MDSDSVRRRSFRQISASEFGMLNPMSDLTKLLQLRTQLQGQRPRTIFARWVDDPRDLPDSNRNDDD